jgi:hypothetical protein
MNTHLMHDLAVEREREAQHRANRARLSTIARCCKPSELARMAEAVRHRLVRPGAACC